VTMSKTACLKLLTSIATSVFVLSGCTAPVATPWRDTSKLALKELTVADNFPKNSGPGHDEKARYSKLLFELEERPISELGQCGKAYRFIWDRSFDQPLSVTAYFPDSGTSYITGRYVETKPRRSASEPFREDVLRSNNYLLFFFDCKLQEQVSPNQNQLAAAIEALRAQQAELVKNLNSLTGLSSPSARDCSQS
jgi:hypothetical protein